MKDLHIPNIFDISTKELSQDAFITWLLKWSDESLMSVNSKLSKCSKDFIRDLLQLAYPDFNSPILKVRAGRQWNNIDIWAKINDEYLIIIEDKTYSTKHSNQLNIYRNYAENWCQTQTPKYKPPVCVYLKTGNESKQSLKFVLEDGFSIYNRKTFLQLLNRHDLQNDIYNDFKKRLNRIEKINHQWEDKIIADWNGNDWQGFFQFLENEINIIGWNHVNNQNNGFWNAVLNWDYWNIYPVYLQIEEFKLCFKISTDPSEPVVLPNDETRSSIRNKLSKLIISTARDLNINTIKKPKRFGHGKYMTVALIEYENWLGNRDDKINKEQVLNNLKFYKEFLLKEIISKTGDNKV